MSVASPSYFTRLTSVDILRGAIMVIMALDHTRDYFHNEALINDPTDLSKSGAGVFLTRWITHFCAPGFLFLAGVSAYLKRSRATRNELSRYLLTRGLWLMFLDITVLRFAVLFNFYYSYNIVSILWLIGTCMVLMSGLIFLRHWAIFAVAMVIVFGHNLLDGLTVNPESSLYVPWVLLINGGLIQTSATTVFFIYATIPWLGIMMFGYFVGRWYGEPYTDKMRRRLLVYFGILSIILFLFFRYTGFYGDPRPAVDYPDVLTSLLSFLNVTKYPVSLQFTLMTIGPLLLILAALEKVSVELLKPLLVFGRVPLFYFIVHFFVIHAAALVVYMIQTGKSLSEIDFHFPASFGGISSDGGVSLFWTYVAWVLVVVALYPLCRWFENYRRNDGRWWTRWL
jgi:uncharacterized membrane protein